MLSMKTSTLASALTLLYATSVQGVPTPTSAPYNANAPGASPLHVIPTRPSYLPLSTFDSVFAPAVANLTARGAVELVAEDMISGRSVNVVAERSDEGFIAGMFKRGNRAPSAILTSKQKQSAIKNTCVDSTGNDTYISSLFYYGGAGTTVFLCPNAVINLTNAVFFSAQGQTLATQGYPTGATRATLKVTASDQSCAIYAAIDGADNIAIRNIQVDGNREGMGLLDGGLALIEMGGNNQGHTLDHVHSFEPRGWSCAHLNEGGDNSCSGAIVTNNDIGPSGHAPSGAQQFRKRDSTGTYAPGQWADGLSIACQGSTVTGNTITDATDGAIVLFGAPGTTVSGNTIIANQRQLLGGINMVDWAPFAGSFSGTVVKGNTIIAQSSMIKLGIAMGGMTWGVDNRTIARTYGGTVKNNVFASGNTGYFGYSIGIAGHENATITGNTAYGSNYGGVESSSCFTQYLTLPTPQPYVADPYTTPGVTFQKGFTFSELVLLICRGPGKITKRGGYRE